jgi:hypothetical protein
MRHPSMTTRGTRIAFALAAAIGLALPKRVECGYPGATCNHAGPRHSICTSYQIEPLGFYLIELVAERDVGFAYEAGDDCR